MASDEPVVGASELRRLDDQVTLNGFRAARQWKWRSFGRLWLEAGHNNRSCGRCRRLRALPEEAGG